MTIAVNGSPGRVLPVTTADQSRMASYGGFLQRRVGYPRSMIILVILVVLALAIGVGAVLEGLLWMLLIGFVLLIAAGWYGWSKFRSVGTR